ncbi:MAG: hypothetical protein ACK2UW_02540 [Anaerolineales bacterium]|jgi:hypothetical protein
MYSQVSQARDNHQPPNFYHHLYQIAAASECLLEAGQSQPKLKAEIMRRNQSSIPAPGHFDPTNLRDWIQKVEHKLRTSTAVILGYADLMKVHHPEDHESIRQTANQAILTNATEISELIEKVSIYTALMTGNYVWIDFNLTEIAAGIVAEANLKLENGGLYFQSELSHMPIHICGDPVLIQNAISGMIEFAERNSPKAGAVMFSLFTSPDFAHLKVISQCCSSQDHLPYKTNTDNADSIDDFRDFILPDNPMLAKTIFETFAGAYTIEKNSAALTIQQAICPLPD